MEYHKIGGRGKCEICGKTGYTKDNARYHWISNAFTYKGHFMCIWSKATQSKDPEIQEVVKIHNDQQMVEYFIPKANRGVK